MSSRTTISPGAKFDLFLRLLRLTPEAKVLNLCCGQGRHVLEFCRRGFGKVECFDRPNFLLSEARERAKSERLPARFCEGDARVLPYVAETFDAVWILGNSFGTLLVLKTIVPCCEQPHRVLRPAGRLLLDVTDGEYLKIHYAPRSWSGSTRRCSFAENANFPPTGTVLSHVRL